MFGHTNRAHTRTATSVRAGKGLVQVQVTQIGPDGTRIRQAHLSVHVRAIHVHLCAARMDNPAYLLDFLFKDTVGRRIRNHQRRQFVLVRFRLLPQVVQVDVSVLVARASQWLITRLYGRSRIGAVSRCRNQDQMTVSLSDAFQIAPDDTQSRIFTRSSGIRLERHSRKTRDGLQLFAQVLNQRLIACCLVFRHQRVHVHPRRIAQR